MKLRSESQIGRVTRIRAVCDRTANDLRTDWANQPASDFLAENELETSGQVLGRLGQLLVRFGRFSCRGSSARCPAATGPAAG